MKQVYKKAIVNVLFAILITVLILFFVPRIWVYFLPFIIAWIIAACASPIVRFLEKKIKIKRKMGSALVIIAVIVGIVFLFYGIFSILFEQLAGWLGSLPQLYEQISIEVQVILEKFVTIGILEESNIKHLTTQFGSEIGSAISAVTDGGSQAVISVVGGITKQIPSVLIGVFVCLLTAYFIVAEKNENKQNIMALIPNTIKNNMNVFSKSIKEAVGGYFKAQVKIELWIYLVLIVGLFVLRVDYALLIALIIAILDFLPLLGAGIVMIPWALFSLICNDYRLALGLFIVWGLTQILRQLIQPKYVGESMGIKPLPALILLYFGYCVDGMAGLLLAIPVGYVIMNLYKAGLFDQTIASVKILVIGFSKYRKIKEDEEKE